MNMNLIQESTIARAWLRGCEYLLERGGSEYTLILGVSDPLLVTPGDRAVERLVNSFLVAHGAFPIHTVAETIFPGSAYRHHGADGVYNVYPDEIYPALKIRRHPDFRWGTYAYRMLRRTRDGEPYSPLQECVKKMRDAAPKHACYEIDLPTDVPTYDDTVDGKKRMGLPCLSLVSFKIMPEHRLQLTALYRHHYYIAKTFGNLLGLARLQQFVAIEAGLRVGPLVCHSTLGRLEVEHSRDQHWSMRDVKELLSSCRTQYSSAADAPPHSLAPADT
ncbi:hypothetical protein [Anaeromyxobacter sp. PSR-1]|uniref:hypothetical protein n=1 Tax=Anaeromyxobacter sp. PSR-1 TaxID=1300915 RepID=UPI001269B337|nr:hypothetical protein [Anaeromyxobacter sp. PSR-1]